MQNNVRALVKKASIVQIKPEYDARFGGCLMVVSEVYSWGVQGYVMVPGADGEGQISGQAYYRCHYNKIVPTGGSAPYCMGEEFADEGEEVVIPNNVDIPIKAGENDNGSKH